MSVLYSRPNPPASALDVVGLWEAWRPAFNLMVCVVGLASCAVIGAVILGAYFLCDVDLFPEPFSILMIPVYGILANLCYTGGWLAEIVVRKAWPQEGTSLAAGARAW